MIDLFENRHSKWKREQRRKLPHGAGFVIAAVLAIGFWTAVFMAWRVM